MIAALRRSFTHLPARGSEHAVGAIEVRRTTCGYAGRGPGGRQEAPTADAIVRWVQYQLLGLLIGARGDLIWLHGAVAEFEGRAVVLTGRRGCGKSTLVYRLWARGWSFLTDDILPLDPATDCVVPFPMLPQVREDPGRDLGHDELAAVPKTEVMIEERIGLDPLPVGAVVLPAVRRGGPTRLADASPGQGALALLEGCWNLSDFDGDAVAHLAQLVRSRPMRTLSFGDADLAADLVAAWVRSADGAAS